MQALPDYFPCSDAPDTQPADDRATVCSVIYLTIHWTNVLFCQGFSVSGNTGITKTEIKASLQRKVNNTWTTISTWSSTGSRTCTLSKTANVLKGYEYRVVSTAKAYKGSKSETKTIISNISKY